MDFKRVCMSRKSFLFSWGESNSRRVVVIKEKRGVMEKAGSISSEGALKVCRKLEYLAVHSQRLDMKEWSCELHDNMRKVGMRMLANKSGRFVEMVLEAYQVWNSGVRIDIPEEEGGSGWSSFSEALRMFVQNGVKVIGSNVAGSSSSSRKEFAQFPRMESGSYSEAAQRRGDQGELNVSLAVSKLGLKKWQRAIVMEVQGKMVNWEIIAELAGRVLGLGRDSKLHCFSVDKAIIFAESDEEFDRLRRISRLEEKDVLVFLSPWSKRLNTFRESWVEATNRWIYFVGVPYHLWSVANFEKLGELFGEVREIHKSSAGCEALDVIRVRILTTSSTISFPVLKVSDGVDKFTVLVYASVTEEDKWNGLWMTYTEGDQRELAMREEMQKDKRKMVVGGPDKDNFLATDIAKIERDEWGGSGTERERLNEAKKGKEIQEGKILSNEEGKKSSLVYSRKNRKGSISGRESEVILPDSDGLFSVGSKKSGGSGRCLQTTEINVLNEVSGDSGRKELRLESRENSSRRKMVKVLNPTPVSYVKGPNSGPVQGSVRASVEKIGGRKSVKEVAGKGNGDRRTVRESRVKVKVERVGSEVEDEDLAVKKRRLLEGKIRKSKRELKALYGGFSPDAGTLENAKAGKGIASRIGSRATRSRRGGKAIKTDPVKISIADTDSEEEECVKSTALVIHEGNITSDTYLSDDRVSSREFGDDDGEKTVMVKETQEMASVDLVDAALMRKVARSIGMSKQELNKKALKEVIDRVVSELKGGESEGVEDLGEEFLGTTEEERMMEEGKFSWSSEESGYGEGSDDDDGF